MGHHTKGDKPGDFSPIKECIGGQISFIRWDPFEFPGSLKNRSEEFKARRLKVELQKGRLAMIGIMGFLAVSSVTGSVSFLASLPPVQRQCHGAFRQRLLLLRLICVIALFG